MRNRVLSISLLLILTMTIFLSGCQNGQVEVPELSRENTLRFMLPGAPSTFDPGISGETFSGAVIDHAFETLVRMDSQGEILPAAAESYTISDDGLVYTFKMRANGKWSDGTAVTAEDFRQSWLRVLDPMVQSKNASVLTPYIKGASAYASGKASVDQVGISTNQDQLIVQLESPTTFFLQLITFWCFAPVKMEVVSAQSAWDQAPETFVGNGPYRVKSIEAGKTVLLEKNPNYWDSPAIKIPGLEILFKQESDDAYELYKSGEIDGVYEVLVNDLRTISDLETQIYIHQAMSTSFIFLNHTHPALKNQGFRAALGQSIDRQEIVDEILLGGGIASRYLVPSSMSLAGESFREFTELNIPANFDSARKQLKSDSLSESELKKPLRVYYLSGRSDDKIMEKITQTWSEELGLTFELEGMEWPQLYQTCLAGDYDIALMGFGADYPHPMTFIGMFLENGFGTQMSKWEDPNFQKSVYETLSIQNPDESLMAYRALENRIIDEYHILPLYHRKLICLMNDRVKGWYRDGLLHFIFRDAELAE